MSSIIVINGEDDFLKERAAWGEASMSLSKSVVQFYLPEDLSSYEEMAEMGSVTDEPPETMILWNAKEVPSLLPEGNVIVVSGKKPISDSRVTRVLNFPRLKDKNVPGWILNEGQRLNIDLSRVANGLFVNCGNDLRKLSSEISKLAAITPSGQAVNPAEAKEIICFSASVTPKSLTDAIRNGYAPYALAFHDKLQEQGDETGWMIAYLQRLVVQSAHVQTLATAGVSDDQAADALGVPPWIHKNVSMESHAWNLPFLVSSAERLKELDLMHKSGKEFARFGLQLEIIRLSEEAKES